MPTLILAESSLETIPTELRNHPSVISYCSRNEKKSSETLLDNSWHFAAMKGIKNEIKRGRPDIIHLTLLAICNTPLYKNNKIEIDNTILLELHDMTFEELITKIRPSKILGFSTTGNKSSFQNTAKIITEDSCIVIGGFQKGHFNETVLKQFDDLKSLHNDSLEAHVIASRILYEYEKTIFI